MTPKPGKYAKNQQQGNDNDKRGARLFLERFVHGPASAVKDTLIISGNQS
jgi:hypothetical protein